MDLKHKYERETGNSIYSGNGQMLPEGTYSDEFVDYLLKQLSIQNVTQRSELLSDFMGYLLENGYLNRQNIKDFIVQDYLISLNCC